MFCSMGHNQMILRCIKIFIIVAIIVSTEGVTVNPSLCPTNKIAPHRRILVRKHGTQRTFGAYYDLFIHDNKPHADPTSSLQEQPLADEPDDCGDIEDYDENDVGSLSATTESTKRQGYSNNRYFLGNWFNLLRPTPSQIHPLRPTKRPTRPPYWSGGFFGANAYRPPAHIHPSDYVKPVHEDSQMTHPTYRPGVVGGILGQVVGVTQVRPTNRPPETTSKLNNRYINNVRFSMLSAQQAANSNRRPRDRKVNEANTSVLGSFIDLFF